MIPSRWRLFDAAGAAGFSAFGTGGLAAFAAFSTALAIGVRVGSGAGAKCEHHGQCRSGEYQFFHILVFGLGFECEGLTGKSPVYS